MCVVRREAAEHLEPDGCRMIRYTARNGTTFQIDPAAAGWVHVIAADEDCGDPIAVAVDLEDLREFLQHLEERLDAMYDVETDADCTAVGPD